LSPCHRSTSTSASPRGTTPTPRAKPGADEIEVTIGDFATTPVEGRFSIAYLVFNTIMNLTTQEAQVAYFRSVAAHLEPGSCFVIEVGVPELAAAATGRDHPRLQRKRDQLGLRRVRRRQPGPHLHHFELVDERVERLSIPFRDAWPAEGGRGGSGLVRCPRVGGPAGAGAMGAVRSFAARWRRTVRLEENWRP
jgi:hypothetical protein